MSRYRDFIVGCIVTTISIVIVSFLLSFIRNVRAEKNDEEVPITIGYERVEITNLQSTDNGTYVYILTDTATNREYLYVLRESGRIGQTGYACASSIVEIGDCIEPRIYTNAETESLINRNNLSHTGTTVAYENGEKIQ